MGTAILSGLLSDSRGGRPKYRYSACVRSVASLERLKRDLSDDLDQVEVGSGADFATQTARGADVIVLGFAPGDLRKIFATPGLIDELEGKTVVSLLAGVSYAQLTSAVVDNGGVKDSCNLVRTLPSLGAKVGKSVTLVAVPEDGFSREDSIAQVESLFERVGSVVRVPEPIMAEATALGAACHALSIVAIDTMADASAADGLPRDTALMILQHCFKSASSLMLSGMTPEQMKNAMAIPKGITINSILDLETEARPAMAKSLRQAVDYTKNMG